MTGFNKFAALLYKELLLRKCHYVGTAFEIIFPIIVASIPCMLYPGLTNINSQKRAEFKWKNFTTFQPIDPLTVYSFSTTDDLEFVYSPSNEITDQFMEDSMNVFFGRSYRNRAIEAIKKSSEAELSDYILQEQKKDEEKVMIGTVFKGFGTSLPTDLDYKIYYTRNFGTRSIFVLNGPDTYVDYSFSFFLQWQAAVGQTFIQKKAEHNTVTDYKLFLQAFPYPEYKYAPLTFSGTDFKFFLHVGLIFFAVAIVKRIVEEKSDGSKEMMETMGVTKSSYWASIFTSHFVTAFILTLVITVIYKTATENTYFYLQTDFGLLFIILLLFMANLILFCMTFSVFLNRVPYAVCALMVVHLSCYQLLQWTIFSDVTFGEYFSFSLFRKLCICLLPSGALLTSSLVMHLFELGNTGVQWRNLTEYPMVPDINMLMVIGMMIFSCVLYSFALWYLDAVWPWQPGVHKPFYFLLTRSYWLGENSVVPDEIELATSASDNDNFEEGPGKGVISIVIKDVSKIIRQGSSSKTVLHGVSLKCYQGQIIALLGHSEAGKTQLINILAGKELPTKGFASITGLDASTKMAQSCRGVCPQRSVLYDELSVEQHVKIYAAMKGASLRHLSHEADRVLDSLKLSSKKAETVSNLSYADKGN